jgi:hypothetical protein
MLFQNRTGVFDYPHDLEESTLCECDGAAVAPAFTAAIDALR